MGLGWLAGQSFKWLKRGWDALPCVYSFPADTLVHVKPSDAKVKDASLGKCTLRPISDITLGDEVLSFAEWKDQGKSGKMDRRLSYEKVTDVYTSYKAQTFVHLTLDDGQTLTATEGHPFKTADGWRDAIMLKKGGKLLLKGGDGDADAERTATIAEVHTEQRTLPVYNLEVANGHTYFVGKHGLLVHNAINCKKVIVSKNKYPESYKHAQETGKPNGPFTVDRTGKNERRRENLRGKDKVGGHDLDEWPPAVTKEGNGASVKPIPSSDNRGSGSTIGNQLRNISNGDKFEVEWIE